MTAVVTENCESCRFTECVNVCPVACFHADELMLYIDADACIDCCACIPACPVHAIYLESDLPADARQWAEINRTRSAELPLIEVRASPLPSAAAKREKLGFS